MHLRVLTPKVIDRARRQGAVITRAEILQLGGSSDHITRLIRSGVLVRIHAGVFVLGGTMIDHALRLRAALAAVGPEGVASHQSAAWLEGMVDRPPADVHVTVGPSRKELAGVVVHRSQTVVARRIRVRGIECTTPGRTLVDLAATAAPAELDDAVDRAVAQGLIRTKDLVALTRAGRGGRPGVAALRRCLGERGVTNVPSPSVLESKMARLMIRYGLPPARPEHVAGQDGEYRIDYAYPAERVAVELYGYASHRTPGQLRADQARQRKLTVQGWTVIVFTWPDVVHTPAVVARDLRDALRKGSERYTKAEIRNT